MTEKAPRNSKELPIGIATDAVRKLLSRQVTETYEAERKARERIAKRHRAQLDRILSRVPQPLQDYVLNQAGAGPVIESDAPPDSEPLTPADVAAIEEGRAAIQRGEGLTTAEVRRELDVADQPVPKGVTEYVPGPAARNAARGR